MDPVLSATTPPCRTSCPDSALTGRCKHSPASGLRLVFEARGDGLRDGPRSRIISATAAAIGLALLLVLLLAGTARPATPQTQFPQAGLKQLAEMNELLDRGRQILKKNRPDPDKLFDIVQS